ncbi:MAG: DUF1349 domain-containing protein [Polyangiaceae bacterium]|nr:DUF1349 domain-containing protein [Polyangiaceae bacterium]
MREWRFDGQTLPAELGWLNPPTRWELGAGLTFRTAPKTDFWQRTHYGFRRDDGHALVTPVTGDFTLTVAVSFEARDQYDQCGLMARVDEQCWVKASAELEHPGLFRLGSVVTNAGYSDWATQDHEGTLSESSYRLSRRGDDFLLEHAFEGGAWRQLRILHLFGVSGPLLVGAYACSPVGDGFECTIRHLRIEDSIWRSP